MNLNNKFIYSDENYKSPFKNKNYDEEFLDDIRKDQTLSNYDNNF